MAVTSTPWTVTWTIKDDKGRKARMSIHLPSSMPAIAGTAVDTGDVDDPLELYVEMATRLLHGIITGQIINVSITKSLIMLDGGTPPFFRAAPGIDSDVEEVFVVRSNGIVLQIPTIREDILDGEVIDWANAPEITTEVPFSANFRAELYASDFFDFVFNPDDASAVVATYPALTWTIEGFTDNRGEYLDVEITGALDARARFNKSRRR